MKTTNNSVKYEILVKQYLPAFLDVSGCFRILAHCIAMVISTLCMPPFCPLLSDSAPSLLT